MKEVKWYVFGRESRRFKQVDSEKSAKSSGSIFLRRKIYNDEGKRGSLRLCYPSGEEIQSFDGSLSNRKSVKLFDENQQYMANLALKCSKLSISRNIH